MTHTALIVSTRNQEKHHCIKLPQWLEIFFTFSNQVLNNNNNTTSHIIEDKEPAPQFITDKRCRNQELLRGSSPPCFLNLPRTSHLRNSISRFEKQTSSKQPSLSQQMPYYLQNVSMAFFL